MSIFKTLISKLFGSNSSKSPATYIPKPIVLSWQERQAERIIKAELELKDWLVGQLQQKQKIPFHWESGNDEAFVYFDDEPDDDDQFQYLGEYIVDKLDIPDAGEFEMNGTGVLYIENGAIRAKYSSTIKEAVDYDEERDEPVYGNEEQQSDDRIIMKID